MKRRGLNLFEWATVMAILVLAAALALPAIARAREGVHRATCSGNLRQLGMSLSLVAAENNGVFPPMKSRDCAGMPTGWNGSIDLTAVYPDYLADLDVLVCPDSEGPASALARWDDGDGVLQPCEVSGIPYAYIGWALPPMLMNTDDMDAFAANVQSAADWLAADPAAAHSDWRLDTPVLGRDTLHRLRDGIVRYQVTDICNDAAANQARTKTAVMWDAFNVAPADAPQSGSGANVLFIDGHVEFVQWHGGDGRFPVNDAGAALSRAMASSQGE